MSRRDVRTKYAGLRDGPTVPCRKCKEPTNRLSRLCLKCTRAQGRKMVTADFLDTEIPIHENGDVYATMTQTRRRHVERWFGDRQQWWDDIQAAKPSLLSRCKKYRLTMADWVNLVVDQNSMCAICGKLDHPLRLNIDHDHWTLRVRGLLCTGCNVGLGLLEIDGPRAVERSRAVLGYIVRTKSRSGGSGIT